MGEREDNVYKAKLAEQAERYDGKEHEEMDGRTDLEEAAPAPSKAAGSIRKKNHEKKTPPS